VSPWFRVDNTDVERIAHVGVVAWTVYTILRRHASEAGECWPSVARLAELAGITERSVRAAIKRLSVAGMLTAEQRQGPKGTMTNLYHLPAVGSPDDGRNETTPGGPAGAERNDTPGVNETTPGGGTRRQGKKTNRTRPNEQEKERPADAGAVPAGLVELIDGWNGLGEQIVKPGNGARKDPPAEETLSGWRRAMKHPAQRAAFSDTPGLLTAIRGAKFCHGQPWFTLPWLFGKNKNGEMNVCRLISGAYTNGEFSYGHGRQRSTLPIGAGQRNAADTAARSQVGIF
jgi:hypothetical protein